MHLMKVDPRALKENPDRTRQTKSSPQADALLCEPVGGLRADQHIKPLILREVVGSNDDADSHSPSLRHEHGDKTLILIAAPQAGAERGRQILVAGHERTA